MTMKKIVFLGDSITDAYHNLGVDGKALGNGYVRMIAEHLEKQRKEKEEEFAVLNRGHDGFTVQGVLRMLGRDCIVQQPDIVSILVGCNDVGVMMNTGKTLAEQEFSEAYEKVLCEIEEYTSARLICMAPFIFPYPHEYISWIPHIRELEEIIRMLAKKHHAVFLPLHDRLQEEAKKFGFGTVTTDGIHLTEYGAKVVAEEWLNSSKEILASRV